LSIMFCGIMATRAYFGFNSPCLVRVEISMKETRTAHAHTHTRAHARNSISVLINPIPVISDKNSND